MNYRVTINWKGLPSDRHRIGHFVLTEGDLNYLEDNFWNELSFDVWCDTQRVEDALKDVLLDINESSRKHFGFNLIPQQINKFKKP